MKQAAKTTTKAGFFSMGKKKTLDNKVGIMQFIPDSNQNNLQSMAVTQPQQVKTMGATVTVVGPSGKASTKGIVPFQAI